MNRICFFALSFFIFLFLTSAFAQTEVTHEDISNQKFDPALLLWYKTPANKWEEALPVGNGRLGAMVYGNRFEETIQLNENTYWTGGPYSSVVKGGHEKLKEIQQLVFDQKFLRAHNLFGRHLMGYPVEQMKYQSLATFHLFFTRDETVSDYKRWLDLSTGVAHVDFKAGDVRYHREVFSSNPDQVIAIRITADKPGSISFSANLRGVRNQAHSNYGTDYFRMNGYGKDGLQLTGKSADYLGVEGKIKYEARVKVKADGGEVSVEDYTLKVVNANSVVIYFTAATNFINYKDVSGDQHQRVEDYLKQFELKSFQTTRENHIKDFQSLMSRASLSLPKLPNSFLPTDERIAKSSSEEDPSLAALAYQFGRYVLISSSRPGLQPANLQGIWNNDMNPPWDSKYTTNINTQMNYWAAESANLSDCSQPLFQMVKEMGDQGGQVAKEHYGARGWVLHQNTDIWRVAAPMDGPTWGTFTVGGAWLVNELWEHYNYTLDKNLASEFYQVMKGSVEFFLDFLVAHPNGKWLVTNPSTSPENFPMSPGNERYFDEVTGSFIPGTTICAGSSIDMQILSDLFANFIQASKILKVDEDLARKVELTRSKLVPPQIGKDGMLQEWADDWGQLEKNHRHFSHMYGLYPGNVFSSRKTPDFLNACKAVLEQRGDGGAGWSRAWKVALWARLHDGNRSLKIFKGYLKEQAFPQLFAKCFTPMQVDGTLGMTAGISEMLVQSHEGALELLPALPTDWSEGKLDGVCARGGFVLNMEWKQSKLTSLQILSKAGEPCRIYLADPIVKVTLNGKKVAFQREGEIVQFSTEKNQTYVLSFK
ncbi:large protein [Cytophagales bacterium WSM2-2]|nr:large protein [Cytophagales bacterium WSM2-2]